MELGLDLNLAYMNNASCPLWSLMYLGRHRNIYYPGNGYTYDGQVVQDCGYDDWESPQCPCDGSVILIVLLLPIINCKLGGYEFLMQNCKLERATHVMLLILAFIDEAGDRICIFGFSRGAYTARALAGM